MIDIPANDAEFFAKVGEDFVTESGADLDPLSNRPRCIISIPGYYRALGGYINWILMSL